MATKTNNTDKETEANDFPGYPLYPPSEDIYSRAKKEQDIDPEDISKNKTFNDEADQWNEKDFSDDLSGSDLDIPGAELDDDREAIGAEDEENNYYSLGGDNHIDLEEYQGE